MATKRKAEYYKVKASFGVMIDGEQMTVNAGEIVSPDSALYKHLSAAAREEHLEPVTSFGRWDVEQATAAPGEKRGD